MRTESGMSTGSARSAWPAWVVRARRWARRPVGRWADGGWDRRVGAGEGWCRWVWPSGSGSVRGGAGVVWCVGGDLTGPLVGELRSAERCLQAAQLAGDVAALGGLLDDRLVFTG